MIVPTMKAGEVYAEVMRDFQILCKKAYITGIHFQKELLRKKLQHEMRCLKFKTPYHNEWDLLFRLNAAGIDRAFYIKSLDRFGTVAYNIQFRNEGKENEEKFLIKYNTHFFNRYNERMNLHFNETAQVIKHFFRNNFDFDIGESQLIEDGTGYIHFIFKEGMGIGWQEDATKTIHIKTFISNKTLNGKLLSLAEHIKNGDDDDEFKITIRRENIKNKII